MSTKVFTNNQTTFNEFYKNRKNCEDEFLDYKLQFHFKEQREKLELTKDIVSFANAGGGVIIFGVSDKSYEWEGLDESSDDIDDIQIRSFIEKYIEKPIGFQCGTYKISGNSFYMITIEKNDDVYRFIKTGEYVRKRKGSIKDEHLHVFCAGDAYGRVGSSCKEISNDLFFLERRNSHILTNMFKIESPYKKYVERKQLESSLLDSLGNQNIRHIRVNGLGGIGKTSFVRNLCEKIYNGEIKLKFKIDAIIWVTGKLDYFSPDGQIKTIRNSSLSYREMLDIFSSVLMIDSSLMKDEELYNEIRNRLIEYPSIIVLDNMETINDEKIHDFYKNIPINCHVIFTSRTDLTTYYTRIDISGFDKNQFIEYVKNSIEEFRPDLFQQIFEIVEPNIDELRNLTGGSPILINFIMCKICAGHGLSSIISKLRELETKKVDINGFYNSVMDFCFNDAFESTTLLDKKVLFAMSISTEEDAYFDISDMSFILGADEYEVGESFKNIYSISFCTKSGESFKCPLLIRAFVEKKTTESYSKLIDDHAIAEKYYEWLNKKRNFESRSENYYDKIKAYDFKRKLAASQIASLKNGYFETHSFNEIIDKFDEIINNHPHYGLPYLEKAKYLRNYDEVNSDDIGALYKKAIECDPTNDFFISEYAFYLNKSNKKAAIDYFNRALELNPEAPNINHGLATCLSALYSEKDEIYNPETILNYFEKGYVKETDTVGDKIRFCGNAHAHATFLLKIKRKNEALMICERGLSLLPNDRKMLTLQGHIMASIDPNWISDTKIRKNRKGIFASLDDNQMKMLINMIDSNDKVE